MLTSLRLARAARVALPDENQPPPDENQPAQPAANGRQALPLAAAGAPAMPTPPAAPTTPLLALPPLPGRTPPPDRTPPPLPLSGASKPLAPVGWMQAWSSAAWSGASVPGWMGLRRAILGGATAADVAAPPAAAPAPPAPSIEPAADLLLLPAEADPDHGSGWEGEGSSGGDFSGGDVSGVSGGALAPPHAVADALGELHQAIAAARQGQRETEAGLRRCRGQGEPPLPPPEPPGTPVTSQGRLSGAPVAAGPTVVAAGDPGAHLRRALQAARQESQAVDERLRRLLLG